MELHIYFTLLGQGQFLKRSKKTSKQGAILSHFSIENHGPPTWNQTYAHAAHSVDVHTGPL